MKSFITRPWSFQREIECEPLRYLWKIFSTSNLYKTMCLPLGLSSCEISLKNDSISNTSRIRLIREYPSAFAHRMDNDIVVHFTRSVWSLCVIVLVHVPARVHKNRRCLRVGMRNLSARKSLRIKKYALIKQNKKGYEKWFPDVELKREEKKHAVYDVCVRESSPVVGTGSETLREFD